MARNAILWWNAILFYLAFVWDVFGDWMWVNVLNRILVSIDLGRVKKNRVNLKIIKCLEHDFNKIAGWTGLKNRVNLKIIKCLEQDFNKIAGWSGLMSNRKSCQSLNPINHVQDKKGLFKTKDVSNEN